MAIGLGLLLLLVALPRLPPRASRAAKQALLAVLVVYSGLTIVGVFFRGENWRFGFTLHAVTSGLAPQRPAAWGGPPLAEIEAHPLPVVLGRREGCLFCHAGVKGLSASHSAEAVGCQSCHLGNPFTLDKAGAHAGMLLVPGNLAAAARSCGTTECHPEIAERVPRSLMATMAGVVEVDREVWRGRLQASGVGSQGPDRQDVAPGFSPGVPGHDRDGEPRPVPRVEELGHEGADEHLRQLCASCHLGAEKAAWGPVHEDSRGGGCTACHLTYSKQALLDLSSYLAERAAGRAPNAPTTHPDISIAISPEHCFGCHSRSGRISTSYEGWMEVENPVVVAPGFSPGVVVAPGFSPGGRARRYRTLEDGRTFVHVAPDVHFERGMACVDCHASREVMGDGIEHARKSEAVKVACEDCHDARLGERSVALERLDAESRKIATLRGRTTPGERFLVTADGALPLVNTAVGADGTPFLITKGEKKRLELRPPAPVCLEGGGHARLTCISCHNAWAPRCTGCHTAFEPGTEAVDLLSGETVRGAWVETASGFSAQPPTLGMRTVSHPLSADQEVGRHREPGDGGEVVDTFIPGMVLTIDRHTSAGGRPDTVFRRLYARAFSHTISKGARPCASCHNDPVAIGYGEGTLRYEPVGDGRRGAWRFEPASQPGPDGLPAGAWVGFLQSRTTGVSTRPDVRPFDVGEQRRILAAGACLTCHEGTSAVMRDAIRDFRATVARASGKCVVPRN